MLFLTAVVLDERGLKQPVGFLVPRPAVGHRITSQWDACGMRGTGTDPGAYGDGVCDDGESCDGRDGTTSCSTDCDGKTNGKPSGRYCYVGEICEGAGCP